jgi:hypothetical protein
VVGTMQQHACQRSPGLHNAGHQSAKLWLSSTTSSPGKQLIVGVISQCVHHQRRPGPRVSVCSGMQDIEAVVKQADIVIAAAGKACLVKGAWLKKGAIVIDVGTNAMHDPSKKSGYRLVGDADFESCSKARFLPSDLFICWLGRGSSTAQTTCCCA